MGDYCFAYAVSGQDEKIARSQVGCQSTEHKVTIMHIEWPKATLVSYRIYVHTQSSTRSIRQGERENAPVGIEDSNERKDIWT